MNYIICFVIALMVCAIQSEAYTVKNRNVTLNKREASNADQMVQNILQWVQNVYSQNSRRIRQGTLREYLPPANTDKPRPFQPGYPPAGYSPEPPFPFPTSAVTGGVIAPEEPSDGKEELLPPSREEEGSGQIPTDTRVQSEEPTPKPLDAHPSVDEGEQPRVPEEPLPGYPSIHPEVPFFTGAPSVPEEQPGPFPTHPSAVPEQEVTLDSRIQPESPPEQPAVPQVPSDQPETTSQPEVASEQPTIPIVHHEISTTEAPFTSPHVDQAGISTIPAEGAPLYTSPDAEHLSTTSTIYPEPGQPESTIGVRVSQPVEGITATGQPEGTTSRGESPLPTEGKPEEFPERPVQPEEPLQPVQPTQPEELAHPVTEVPSKSEEPVQPEVLTILDVPSQPEVPQPEQPAQPIEPIYPKEPESQPEEPVQTETPILPEKPSQPEEPTQPESPIRPEEPSQPQQPVQPEIPVYSEVSQPEQPVHPEEPVQSTTETSVHTEGFVITGEPFKPEEVPESELQPVIPSERVPIPVGTTLIPTGFTASTVVESRIGGSDSKTTQSPEINTIPGKVESTVTDDDDSKHPPHIHALSVECGKEMMTINIEFNREFNGVIYSKGHFNTPECRYVQENSGQTKYTFTVNLNMCGTEFINAFDTQNQSYLENVLVLQNEVGIQEVWDTVRSVRCLWEGNLKDTLSVAFSIGMLSQEIVTFSGDTAMAKLDVVLGRGPFGEPANGLVKIGEQMTLVVTVSGDPGFDLQVKDCKATDAGSKNIIPLTDENGCILKPKVFGSFQKTRDTGSSGASIIAYAYFNAFKFPDEMDLTIECNIELCKTDCDMCSKDPQLEPSKRRRRDVSYNSSLGDGTVMGKRLQVILPEDINEKTVLELSARDHICMSAQSFLFASAALISLALVSSTFSIFLWLKRREKPYLQ